eukprot:Seg557.6 transcript_id=Seg557.6/GoldUCD/mRNA.D3Y31 product="hypothetical protein" protein_id=Seg557.6/GoldUCD/D3Y31
MEKQPACSRSSTANSSTNMKGTKASTPPKSVLRKTTETEVEHNIEKQPSSSRSSTSSLKASMGGSKMSEEKRQSSFSKGTPVASPTGAAVENKMNKPSSSSRGSTTSLKIDSRRESETKQLSQSLRVIPANITTETAVDQFQLERARLAKKREMKTVVYGRYTRGFYGSTCEKEDVRREQREALLHQIQRKDENTKDLLQKKVKESETAVAYDQACIDADRQDHIKKANYLKQFRDGNKQLIEEREQERRRRRDEEKRLERELWNQNPFNWSKTLT